MSPIQNGSGLVYPLRFLKRSFFLTHIFMFNSCSFRNPVSAILHQLLYQSPCIFF